MERLREVTLSPEEYLAWEASQPTRYEYVGGRARAMVGSSRNHNRIVNDARDAIQAALERRGSPWEVYQTDFKVRTPRGNYRYPDVVVDCADRPEPGDNVAGKPALVIEVLSEDSTLYRDQSDKPDEYKAIDSVASIVLFWQSQPRADAWHRHDGAWINITHIGLDAVVDIPALGIALPMAAVYRRCAFGQDRTPLRGEG